MTVKEGSKVKVEYTGSFTDGTVFDSSEKHGKPLEFEAGAKMVVPGFDKAVMGMKEGEEKEFTLTSAEGYGDRKEELIKKIPREQIPKDQEVKEGMMIGVGLPNGGQLPAKIVGVSDSEVTLDLNHPLAGKELKFKIKVVGIE